MPKTFKIIGPPGTGKTTYLLQQIERACDKYFPKDIGAVSFTKVAVNEMKKRVMDRLDVPASQIPYIRTIHSLCFELLLLKKENVMGSAQRIKDFNEAYPEFAISIDSKVTEDTSSKNAKKNDELFYQSQVYRNKMIDKDSWEPDVYKFYTSWNEFMVENELIDFTGMLEQSLAKKLMPDIKVLFIDESQDLTGLQFELMKLWGAQCNTIIYVGDSDQCIFRFGAAQPESFIDLKADKTIHLNQSFRLSPAVKAKAMHIIDMAHNHETIEYKSTDQYGEGSVEYVDAPDFTLPGSHMYLCRCNFQVHKIMDYLTKNNIPFHNPNKTDHYYNPLKQDATRSIKAYLNMLSDEELTTAQLKQIVKNCISKTSLMKGAKTHILAMPDDRKRRYGYNDLCQLGFTDDFMDQNRPVKDFFRIKTKTAEMLYYLADNDPDALFKLPAVLVGTVHSVKGEEASNVWITPNISHRIKQSLRDNTTWDDECRVAYVAVTRAKKKVGIIKLQNNNPFL